MYRLQEVEVIATRATPTIPVAYSDIRREEIARNSYGTDIPTLLALTAGTPQDFREFRSFRPGISSEFNHIRDFKGYDHPFVVDGWKPNILGEVGTLREPRSGRSVTVLSSQPSVMIYTGNWLASGCPETKSGGRYADYDGVPMECQNYPDAVNHPEFPSPLLKPGELYCQKIVFRFGTF